MTKIMSHELNGALGTLDTMIVCAVVDDAGHPLLPVLRTAYLALQDVFNAAEELEMKASKKSTTKSRGPR